MPTPRPSPTLSQRRKATLVAKLCAGSVYARTSPVRESAEAALLKLSERQLQDIVAVVNFRPKRKDSWQAQASDSLDTGRPARSEVSP